MFLIISHCLHLRVVAFQNTAAESREQYRQVSSQLVEKSHELAQISDELDRVKHEMEERGSSMTDGSKYKIILNYLIFSLITYV